MKILTAIKSGFFRSVRSWRGVLIFWLVSLTLVSFLVVPLKSSLKAALGKSMITEKLMDGINFDVLADLGTNLHSIGSSLFSGIILLSLTALIINVFIAGGLFASLKKETEKFTSESFFMASAKYFWSFMVISAMLYLIVIFLIIVVIAVPVGIAGKADSAPEGIVFRTLAISCSVFLLFMTLIFLVADYARAWQTSHMKIACFKALGYGFSQTFRNFFSSIPLMIIMIVFQALMGLAMIKLIEGYTPVTGGGVFMLFIISQLLLLLKIFLKVLRYGSVTSLMEQNSIPVPPSIENTLKSDPEILTDNPVEYRAENDVR